MTKNQKIIAISFGALTAGVLAFFIFDKLKAKPTANGGSLLNFGDGSGSDYSSPSSPSVSFPLKKGSKGEQVKALQRFLNSEEDAGLNIDGDFGNLTETAWLKNQVCDIVANTKTECWKNYKQHWASGVVGQVDKEFYDTNIKSLYEN